MISTVSAVKLSKVNQRVTYREIHRMLRQMNRAKAEKLVNDIPDWSTREQAQTLLRACYVS